MNYLVVVVITLLFLDFLATVNARATLSGKGQRVEVTLANGRPARTATLLGTTGQFLFLFDAAAGRVVIHPHQSVVSINLLTPVVADLGAR